MSSEIAFETAGKREGLQIWRIENFALNHIPQSQYGNFFNGDCYLVLSSKKSGSGLLYDLHFWIGSNSSQDEQGAAAALTTQMDDHLKGLPTQYRETEGYESKKFKTYFPGGILIKEGGIHSGFNHVEVNDYTDIRRLLHVKGKKNVIAREVPLSWASFNNGDVFIIDIGQGLIQWNAPQSNRQERMKGGQLARCIRDRERGGRIPIVTIDAGTEDGYPQCQELIKGLLGPPPKKFRAAQPDEVTEDATKNTKLYHVTSATGNLVVTEIAQRPLQQNMLNHNDCYCLDNCGQQVFVWKGKGATKEEKSGCMNKALQYMSAKGYGNNVQMEVVNDGAESALFRSCFASWKDAFAVAGSKQAPKQSNIAKVEKTKFDASTLHQKPHVAAQERMVDDGSGQVDVFRVENNQLSPVPAEQRGKFYGGDCYIVFYTYMLGTLPNYIIYIWQGRHSNIDEVTASAYLAVELDRQFRDEPVQIRVTMGKEPRHFMAMFKGKMLVYEGGTGRNTVEVENAATQFFQIRGVDENSTKAIEVMPIAASLNSNDVFMLNSKQFGSFLWFGRGCSGDERELGRQVAKHITGDSETETVVEGQEPPEFWAAIGGKTEYSSGKQFEEDSEVEPRLFHLSNATGKITCDEVFDFAQEDLEDDDIMMLDTWSQLFLWIGENANKEEKEQAAVVAYEYLVGHPAGRDPNTNVILVKQGREPPIFTGWFMAWDPHMWANGKSYDQVRAEMGNDDLFKTIELKDISNNTPAAVQVIDGNQQRYLPYDQLKSIDPEQAFGIDITKKENHLIESDFEPVFGMTRATFNSMPKWKQDNKKKAVGLF